MREPYERRRRRALAAAGAASVLVAAGAVLVRVGGPEPPGGDDGRGHAVGVPTSSRAGGPPSADGAPGAGRNEEGAVSAAVAYTAAPQRWLYLTDEEVAAAVGEVATPEAARSLIEETVEETRIAREELVRASGRVWWLVHPLAWRVESHGPDDASVAVWAVTVLSATGVAAPQAEWVTVTVDLAWVDGRWRVDAVRDRPGPTPMTGPQDDPWDAQPFDDALEGFSRIATEPVA